MKPAIKSHWNASDLCAGRPERVEVEQVPCTRVSMDLFDPIYSCGVVRPSGHLVKCFHDVYPDYDELRQVLASSSPSLSPSRCSRSPF